MARKNREVSKQRMVELGDTALTRIDDAERILGIKLEGRRTCAICGNTAEYILSGRVDPSLRMADYEPANASYREIVFAIRSQNGHNLEMMVCESHSEGPTV